MLYDLLNESEQHPKYQKYLAHTKYRNVPLTVVSLLYFSRNRT